MTSQVFLIPTMLLLFVFLLVPLLSIGSILMEYIQERRKNRFSLDAFLQQIQGEDLGALSHIVSTSALYKRQKDTLIQLLSNVNLSGVAVKGIAQKLLLEEETYYDRFIEKTDLIAKLGPMFGLLGTLIPLGPGLLALGQGDVVTLSNSLLVAFDTTIAGLVAAAICYVISKIRRRWYEDNLVTTEAIMEYILEEVSADAEG